MNAKIFVLTQKRFSELVRTARDMKGDRAGREITQAEAAEYLRRKGFKMSDRTYQNYEQGASMPGPETALEMLNAMGLRANAEAGYIEATPELLRRGGQEIPEGVDPELLDYGAPQEDLVKTGVMPVTHLHPGIAFRVGGVELLAVDFRVLGRNERLSLDALGRLQAEDAEND